MDVGTIAGLLVGVTAILVAAGAGGQVRGFLDPLSAVLVLGGTVAATLIHFPTSQFLQAMRSLQDVVFDRRQSPAETAALMVTLSETARRQGVLALENNLAEMPLEIMRRAILRVVDGAPPAALREYLQLELDAVEESIAKSRVVFEALAAYSPAFGMIGTLVGLVKMLSTLRDPSSLGPAMALALVTTFYGAVLANLVFLPIAGKLETRSQHELLLGQLVLEGAVAISAGEHPAVIRDTLRACVGGRGADAPRRAQYDTETEVKVGVP